jgi:hypothetical protein
MLQKYNVGGRYILYAGFGLISIRYETVEDRNGTCGVKINP